MGLDTTHNAWHGPYSSFNQFRHGIATVIGINLNDYAGYGNVLGKDLETIDHPLKDFFNHSDCDGEFTPEQCKVIADAMDQIIKKLPVPLPDYAIENEFLKSMIQFRDGCLLAYSLKESLEFH